MADTVRAFVSAELPPEVLRHLADLLHRLRALEMSAVRWVRAEGIHLTLKFLGDVEVARLAAIQEALEKAVRGQPPFRLHLHGTGTFPSPGRPRVAWVGLGGDVEAVRGLHQRVEESLRGQGFPPEGRPFSPHLTLGRVRDALSPRDRERLLLSLEALPVEEGLDIPVGSISLMRSTLLPDGARYDRIRLIPF